MKQWLIWAAVAAAALSLAGCADRDGKKEPTPDENTRIEAPLEEQQETPAPVPQMPETPRIPRPDPLFADELPNRTDDPVDPDDPVIPIVPQPPAI